MQSEKVLIMPNRLRHDEKPPYPEFAVEIVREFTKTISAEISPMREDIGEMKHAVGSLELQSRTHGEKLEQIVGMNHRISTVETRSENQSTRIAKIEGHVSWFKGGLWVVGAILAIIGGVASILQLIKYFLG
jgi:hypothetical protein